MLLRLRIAAASGIVLGMKTNHAEYRITDLDATDRPRERLVKYGADKLDDEELIAILIRVGLPGENAVQVGKRLLQTFNGLSGLYHAEFSDLSRQRGIGMVKAVQIKAAIELGRRLNSRSPQEQPLIQSPADAAEVVMYEMSHLPQENLWILNLDTRNRLINVERLYQGSLNTSIVRIAEVFKSAILKNAASILMVHNHPSGDPTPSPEDANLTRLVVNAGRLLDIEVLDHVVIGKGRWISLKERGLGFN